MQRELKAPMLLLWIAIGLLGGAPLIAKDQGQTGNRALPPLRELVNLPPFVVDETLPNRWRYAKIPGVEVLSCCSDDVTQQLIEQNDRLYQLLEVFLPRSLQPQFAVPTTYVLYPERGMPSLARKLSDTLIGRTPMAVGNIQFMPNIRCPGVDSLVLCFVLKDFRSGWHQVQLTPGFLHYLLSARTPTLPQWYVDGMLELYRRASLSTDFSVGLGGSLGPPLPFGGGGRPPDNALKVDQTVWLSPQDTEMVVKLSEKKSGGEKLYPQLEKHLLKERQWVPLAELFAPWRSTNEQELWLLRNEAALFIRWAFDPDGYALRQSLWRFVAESCSGGATEELFKSCFDMTYAEADRALRAYLPQAVRHSFSLPSPDFRTAPQADLRPATLSQRCRLKGRLERLEVAYVQKIFPQAVPAYRQQALDTLRKSYDEGDRNPELLAELGLCHCDAGNDVAAKPFLEAATKAGVMRPRAWLELARVRYEASAGAPDARTAEAILALLTTAHRQAPPLPGVYELMVRVLMSANLVPSAEQYALLADGVRLFPREGPLLYAVAVLNATRHRPREAEALIAQALQVTPEGPLIAKLHQLRAALAGFR